MAALLEGRHVLVVLPTGYGKSLIYQVPSLLIDRPVVAVSPLIALMRDQEQSLRKRNIPVLRIDSTLRATSRRQNLSRLRKGGRLIVLTTPESLEKQDVREALMEAKPQILCIDEAHCISEWGHDFRPAYLRIGSERRALGIPQVLALTATATPKVRDDITQRLDMDDAVEIWTPPVRENLVLQVENVPGNLKIEAAARLIRKLRRPGIVYCATTKAVDEIYGALVRAGIPVARYHGKMKTAERNAEQRRYMKGGKRLVMVATSAFGMGIDKPDIRYILHFQVPGSLEQYVQEAGRAGRDGKESKCVLLYDPADASTQKYLQRQSRPNSAQLTRVANALAAWAEENKPVSTRDLALSAEVPGPTCASLCVALEDLGLIELDDERRYVALVTPDELRDSADELARRFETLRREDSKRLTSVLDYGKAEICRDIFIRDWFGEEEPPECGRCDHCQSKIYARGVIQIGSAPEPEEEEDQPLLRRKRSRRNNRRGKSRRRRRGRRPDANKAQAQSGAEGGNAGDSAGGSDAGGDSGDADG
jgi:ATP-dependent DNA helicase RecQ